MRSGARPPAPGGMVVGSTVTPRIARHRSPAGEMGALPRELFEPLAVLGIPVTQQDQAVGPVAVLIADVPIVSIFWNEINRSRPLSAQARVIDPSMAGRRD